MTPQDPPTITQPPPASPPPGAPPEPRRVTRSSTDRLAGGVAAGLARHFGTDPALVRVGFVLLALLGGSGIALYALLWLLLPADDAPAAVSGASSTAAKSLLLVLVVVAVLALGISIPGAIVSFPLLVVVAVVGALGVLVWRAAGGEGSPSLVRASLVVLAVTGAGLLGLAAAFAAAFGGGTAVAWVVIGLGTALAVGGILGGARWLALPALVIAVPAALVSASGLDLEGGIGERDLRPASAAEMEPAYRLGIGELRVDLRDVDFPAGPTDLAVEVGMGEVVVTVPAEVCVQLRGHAGAGEIDAFGRTNEGIDVLVERAPDPRAGAPVLRLDAEAGLGRIAVEHDAFTPGQPACAA